MRLTAVRAAIVLAAIAVTVPAHAMKEPPKDTPISSSGSSGGSSGSSGGGTPVPEPSSLILFGAGAAAFMAAKRRKQLR